MFSQFARNVKTMKHHNVFTTITKDQKRSTLFECSHVARAYSSCFMHVIVARMRLAFFKMFSNCVQFCPYFVLFCLFFALFLKNCMHALSFQNSSWQHLLELYNIDNVFKYVIWQNTCFISNVLKVFHILFLHFISPVIFQMKPLLDFCRTFCRCKSCQQ